MRRNAQILIALGCCRQSGVFPNRESNEMDISYLYEKATEDLIEKHGVGSMEILYDYLESHGYVVSFKYVRLSDATVERKFYLFNYHCSTLGIDRFGFSGKSEEQLLSEVISGLKEEYHNVTQQTFEVVDNVEVMYEMSSNLPFVMSYCKSSGEDSFVNLCESAVFPLVRFVEGELKKSKAGLAECRKYEKLVGIFLNLYFASPGFRVVFQKTNGSDQHRRDFFVRIKHTDIEDFNDLIKKTDAKSIVVECKNSVNKKIFIEAVNQVERYSRASNFGSLALIFARKKPKILTITDYVSSSCVIVVMDDRDINNWMTKISLSYNYYSSHKNRSRFLLDINGCLDLFERYQEICEQ
jgi:hypothetical protein